LFYFNIAKDERDSPPLMVVSSDVSGFFELVFFLKHVLKKTCFFGKNMAFGFLFFFEKLY